MNRPWIQAVGFPTVLAAATIAVAACSGQDSGTTSTSGTASTTEFPSSTVTTAPGPSRDSGSTVTTAPATTTEPELPPLQGLSYQPVATGVDFPVVLIPEPGSQSLLLALKGGEVMRLAPSGETELLLDVSDDVRNEGEQGLLGMATHPDDPTRILLHYSDNSGDTTVSEFTVADDGTIDRGSERALLTASQPAGNHNGGWIQFGPDGSVYLGLGDGGGANDQFGNGRRDDTLLAGLVRIDVDTGEAEKFAKGLRNPWRFWIEGDLVYIADVGQNAYEEISVAQLVPGVDYGWSIMEGMHCFPSGDSCDQEGLLPPVVEVEHGDAGTCSITGGVVYHGSEIPELRGHYLYSDYCGGYLRSFRYAEDSVAEATDWTDSTGVPGQVVSFGYDAAGEVYVLTTSEVLRLVASR